jgi:hypothetical protein
MQKKTILFFSFFLFIIFGESQTPFKIKSCKIELAFGSPYYKGTETIIFNDYGKTDKVTGVKYFDTSAKMDVPKGVIGKRAVYHFLQIQTPDSVYSIDLDSAKGYGRIRINWGDSSLSISGKRNKIREDTILNKKCDVIDFHGMKIWYWNGIALKKEFPTPLTGSWYEYATSIDDNYIIKEDEFNVPKGTQMQ